MTKLSLIKVKKAIEDSYGVKSVIAKKCNCTWVNLYYYLQKHPELNELITKEQERIIDLVEGRLYQIALNGDIGNNTTLQANIKILNSLTKKWNDKQEIISKNLNINIDLEKEEIKNKVFEVLDDARSKIISREDRGNKESD